LKSHKVNAEIKSKFIWKFLLHNNKVKYYIEQSKHDKAWLQNHINSLCEPGVKHFCADLEKKGQSHQNKEHYTFISVCRDRDIDWHKNSKYHKPAKINDCYGFPLWIELAKDILESKWKLLDWLLPAEINNHTNHHSNAKKDKKHCHHNACRHNFWEQHSSLGVSFETRDAFSCWDEHVQAFLLQESQRVVEHKASWTHFEAFGEDA